MGPARTPVTLRRAPSRAACTRLRAARAGEWLRLKAAGLSVVGGGWSQADARDRCASRRLTTRGSGRPEAA